jgi:VCBS repeat-containing protein
MNISTFRKPGVLFSFFLCGIFLLALGLKLPSENSAAAQDVPGGFNNAPIARDDTGRLFAVSPFQNVLFELNPLTYLEIGQTTVLLPGFTVTGVNSTAIQPGTGTTFVILKVSGVSGRVLATFDAATSTATQIGNLGDNFSNLAFTPDGTLYGVTGDGASVPETLYTIDPTTAVPTFFMTLGNGADGEIIAYNPDDDLMYHSSGNGTVVFESINLFTQVITNISPSLGTGEIFHLRYIGNSTFLSVDIGSRLGTVTTAGVFTPLVSGLSDDFRGFAYDGFIPYNGTEDTPLTITSADNHLLVNDFDGDADPLTAILDTTSPGASVDLLINGTFTYTPPANLCGIDTFTYHVNDGLADSTPATVTLSLGCVNDPLIAVDDLYTPTEDIPFTVSAPGFLGNDSDPDGGVFTTTLLTSTSNGDLQFNLDGSFVYTSTANFNGPDSFTYQIFNAFTETADATVTLNVMAVNDVPISVGESYTTSEDLPLAISAPGVLSNDSDPVEGDSLTAILDTDVTTGTLALNSDGSFTYTPPADWFGVTPFTYHANDGTDNANTVTVTLTVTAVNDAPVSLSDSYTTTENILFTVPAPGVLGNDSDVDGDSLTAVLDTDVTTGTLTLNNDGSFSYTPSADWSGTTTFTYHANDGTDNANTVTVTLTVTANAAPVSLSDSYTTTEDTPLTMPAPGVLSNDSDSEGDSLTAVLDTDVTTGTLTLNSDGSFSYTPPADWSGTTTFTYHANDGQNDSNIVVVTLTVTASVGLTIYLPVITR